MGIRDAGLRLGRMIGKTITTTTTRKSAIRSKTNNAAFAYNGDRPATDNMAGGRILDACAPAEYLTTSHAVHAM